MDPTVILSYRLVTRPELTFRARVRPSRIAVTVRGKERSNFSASAAAEKLPPLHLQEQALSEDPESWIVG